MRILLFVMGIFTVTAGIGTRADAQNYPWCAIYDVGDAVYNCGFVSREQCMTTVSGIGGFCEPNTEYQVPASTVHPSHRAHKHYSQQPS